MSPLNIAHRGGAGLWPENTLAAFEAAVRLGADGAELDVQLTKDGEVVVFHDHRLKADLVRDGDDEWLKAPGPRILDLTLEELERYDVGRPRPGSAYANAHPQLAPQDGLRIPRLQDVTDIARRAPKPFRLFVELKTSFADRSLSAPPETLAEATLAVLKKADYLERSVLVGFDWPGLLHAKKIEPRTECWFTTLAQSWFRDEPPPPQDDPPSPPALKMLRHWAETGTSPWAGGFDAVRYGGSIVEAIKAAGADGWFAFYRDAGGPLYDDARKLDLKVGAWTVNAAADMRALMRLDAICTDRPDVLKGLLGKT
ncbi:MAG TPA: glycerophosphodiester phosphodiesterase family protein [Rhizomicrobium sp.]|nr:glycerophosphodiester phosphodiesterase family protein [Rhizomicrobium sp.]